MKEKMFSKEKLFRRLLEFLKPNSEYDVLLLIKNTKTILQIEVKSSAINQEDRTKSENNVKSKYYSAKDQLLKGKEMFKKIPQLFNCSSDSWNHVGLVCFPYIQSRKEFDYLGLEDDLKVKYNI